MSNEKRKKPSYKDKNGTSKVGDALRWLTKQGKTIAPEILDLAGSITGIESLKKLGAKISGDKVLTEFDKELLLAEIDNDIRNIESARNMQMEALKQSDVFSKRYIYYLTSFWSIIAGVYLFCVTFVEIANERAADTILGVLLGTIIASMIKYFFGNSKGSKDKTQDLMNVFKTKN